MVPAIAAARARGLDVSDPQPPDTVFLRARRASGHRGGDVPRPGAHPVKLLAFDSGVNVSIGLPILRTTVDHGPPSTSPAPARPARRACSPRSTWAVQLAAARRGRLTP